MSTTLPLRLYRPLSKSHPFARPYIRPFSTTNVLLRGGTQRGGKRLKRIDPVQTEAAAEHRKEKSPQALEDEQLKDARNLPDDIGLVAGTIAHASLSRILGIVTPEGSRYSWGALSARSFSRLVRYELKWLWARIQAPFMLRNFKNSISSRPAVYWFWGQQKHLRNKAEEKYKHLYQSFAKGDMKAISEMCLSGVARQFQERLSARPKDLQMEWSADNVRARVVSNRAQLLNISGPDSGIHQIVFRVKSNQSLKIRSADARHTATKGRRVVEYLVLQKQFIQGQERHKDWMVWGFLEESTPERIADDEAHQREVLAYNAAHSAQTA